MLLQLVALACGLCCIGISYVTADVLKAEVSPMQHNTHWRKERKTKFNFNHVNVLIHCISLMLSLKLALNCRDGGRGEEGGINYILNAVIVTHD